MVADEHPLTILATRDMCFGCFLVQHMTRSVFERSDKTYRVVMAQRLHDEARATTVICRRRAIRPTSPTSSVDSPGAAKGNALGDIAKLPPTLNSCTERLLCVNGSGGGPNSKSRLSLSLLLRSRRGAEFDELQRRTLWDLCLTWPRAGHSSLLRQLAPARFTSGGCGHSAWAR